MVCCAALCRTQELFGSLTQLRFDSTITWLPFGFVSIASLKARSFYIFAPFWRHLQRPVLHCCYTSRIGRLKLTRAVYLGYPTGKVFFVFLFSYIRRDLTFFFQHILGIHCFTTQRQIMSISYIVHKKQSIHCKRQLVARHCIFMTFGGNNPFSCHSLIIRSILICRQTMVLVFYLFCIILMMLIRPIFNGLYLKNGKNAIYSALYFMPFLALLHTVIGGLICKY